MTQAYDILRGISVFAGLNDQELAVLGTHVNTRRYPKNTVIIQEGDEANALYVIESGQAKVYLSNEDGKEVIINMLGQGELFGELALIDDAPRSASVKTTKPTTLAVISRSGFKQLLASHTDIALRLLVDMTRRVRLLSESIRNLALLDVYGRVAKVLLDLAQEHDGRLIIREKPTQQDIANRVGASREMVARIMKDLLIGGYVRQCDDGLVILNTLPRAY